MNEYSTILTARFLNDLAEEVTRARVKFPRNSIMYMALAEEFGELGNALIEHRWLLKEDERPQDGPVNESTRHVWSEAVQTAAMALRVAVDGDSSVPEYSPDYEVISVRDEER